LARELPGLLARFDWYLPNPIVKRRGAPEHRRLKDPRTVFALPSEMPKLMKTAAEDFDQSHADRVVVFGGEDMHMTKAFGGNRTKVSRTIARLRKYFKSIFFIAQDIPDPFVKGFPIGLAEHYFRPSLPDVAVEAITSASLSREAKPRAALAAWGAYHDMEAAAAYRKKMPPSTRIAFESRWRGRRWAESRAAKEADVHVFSSEDAIQPRQWLTELARYRFLISPLGDGIQSSKTIEAFLVLTIPIVQRGPYPVHDRLVRMGFPMIVVANWDEISRERLWEWWGLMAPRLARFRHNCITSDAYWRLITGVIDYCD